MIEAPTFTISADDSEPAAAGGQEFEVLKLGFGVRKKRSTSCSAALMV